MGLLPHCQKLTKMESKHYIKTSERKKEKRPGVRKGGDLILNSESV